MGGRNQNLPSDWHKPSQIQHPLALAPEHRTMREPATNMASSGSHSTDKAAGKYNHESMPLNFGNSAVDSENAPYAARRPVDLFEGQARAQSRKPNTNLNLAADDLDYQKCYGKRYRSGIDADVMTSSNGSYTRTPREAQSDKSVKPVKTSREDFSDATQIADTLTEALNKKPEVAAAFNNKMKDPQFTEGLNKNLSTTAVHFLLDLNNALDKNPHIAAALHKNPYMGFHILTNLNGMFPHMVESLYMTHRHSPKRPHSSDSDILLSKHSHFQPNRGASSSSPSAYSHESPPRHEPEPEPESELELESSDLTASFKAMYSQSPISQSPISHSAYPQSAEWYRDSSHDSFQDSYSSSRDSYRKRHDKRRAAFGTQAISSSPDSASIYAHSGYTAVATNSPGSPLVNYDPDCYFAKQDASVKPDQIALTSSMSLKRFKQKMAVEVNLEELAESWSPGEPLPTAEQIQELSAKKNEAHMSALLDRNVNDSRQEHEHGWLGSLGRSERRTRN